MLSLAQAGWAQPFEGPPSTLWPHLQEGHTRLRAGNLHKQDREQVGSWVGPQSQDKEEGSVGEVRGVPSGHQVLAGDLNGCCCAQGSQVHMGTGTQTGRGRRWRAHGGPVPEEKGPSRTKVQPNSSFIRDAGFFVHCTGCAQVFPRERRGRQGQHCSMYTEMI